MKEVYDNAWKSIINPMKFTHTLTALCPQFQNIGGQILQRIDISFVNRRGDNISAVILKQAGSKPQNVILYLHGNGGSKLQSLGFVPAICSNKIALISFDFVGCGNSSQGYLTYGVNQSKDAQQVINESKKIFPIQKITLWGRSMGAVTAIMFCQRNRQIVDAMILDCPFRKLSSIIKTIISTQTHIPQTLSPIVLFLLAKQIQKKIGFSLFDIDYLKMYKKHCKDIPTMFLWSQRDKLVTKQNVHIFFNSCRAHKQTLEIFEEHQEERCLNVIESCINWIRGIKKRKTSKLKLCYLQFQIEGEQFKNTPNNLCCH